MCNVVKFLDNSVLPFCIIVPMSFFSDCLFSSGYYKVGKASGFIYINCLFRHVRVDSILFLVV